MFNEYYEYKMETGYENFAYDAHQGVHSDEYEYEEHEMYVG
jgi:hypothetical protein